MSFGEVLDQDICRMSDTRDCQVNHPVLDVA